MRRLLLRLRLLDGEREPLLTLRPLPDCERDRDTEREKDLDRELLDAEREYRDPDLLGLRLSDVTKADMSLRIVSLASSTNLAGDGYHSRPGTALGEARAVPSTRAIVLASVAFCVTLKWRSAVK